MSDIKERDRISFRLRGVDADLREATKGLASDRISDLARDGLRLILGIRTTKRVEVTVTEQPIQTVVPTPMRRTSDEQPTQFIRSKPAVWTPGTVGGQ